MANLYMNFNGFPEEMIYGSGSSDYESVRDLDISFSGVDPNQISECFERDSLRYSRDISLDEEGVRL